MFSKWKSTLHIIALYQRSVALQEYGVGVCIYELGMNHACNLQKKRKKHFNGQTRCHLIHNIYVSNFDPFVRLAHLTEPFHYICKPCPSIILLHLSVYALYYYYVAEFQNLRHIQNPGHILQT